MTTNHYNPSFQHPALRNRPNAWDCIPAAYEAVGLEPPAKPTADILGALAAKDSPSDILDTLEARFLNGNDGPELADEYRQAWLDATFYEAASKRLHAAQATTRSRRINEDGIRDALRELAPEVDKLAARLADAAGKMHPAAPLDQLAAHETGTVAEVGQCFDIAIALSAVASLHDSPELPSLDNLHDVQRLAPANKVLRFLPVLHLPITGYPEPSSVEEVAAGVGNEPHEGHTSVLALIEAANHGADELLVNVARGRYPGVTIRLAETPQEIAKRVQRVVDAMTSKAYTYERAQAHRTGMFTGAGQKIEQWAIFVLAHGAGVPAELVTTERKAPILGRRR